jgi:hypothetical protein
MRNVRTRHAVVTGTHLSRCHTVVRRTHLSRCHVVVRGTHMSRCHVVVRGTHLSRCHTVMRGTHLSRCHVVVTGTHLSRLDLEFLDSHNHCRFLSHTYYLADLRTWHISIVYSRKKSLLPFSSFIIQNKSLSLNMNTSTVRDPALRLPGIRTTLT